MGVVAIVSVLIAIIVAVIVLYWIDKIIKHEQENSEHDFFDR